MSVLNTHYEKYHIYLTSRKHKPPPEVPRCRAREGAGLLNGEFFLLSFAKQYFGFMLKPYIHTRWTQMTSDNDNQDENEDFIGELPTISSAEDNTFAPLEHTVCGEVMRIVFSSTDGDYTVLRLNDDKGRELTLVGSMPNVMEGQEIEASGRWELHKEHGRQFRVNAFHAVLPSSPEGIKRYLASGVLPGIGETYAERIVKHFGVDTIRILDNYSERLKEVPGIGTKRIKEIRDAWRSTNAERETRIYLQGIGLSQSLCSRVIAQYGKGAAAEIVRRNPYRLASEVDGVGFITADSIAAKLGVVADSPLRICAGLVYTLDEVTAQGHTCCPREILLLSARKLLDVPQEALEKGLETAIQENKVSMETVQEAGEEMVLLFPRRLRYAEINLAESVCVLLANQPAPFQLPIEALGEGYDRLNKEQRQAVLNAFQYGFSIVTGGPGVGKTTVVNQMTAAACVLRLRCLLAAPTGRAAKRLSETTGRDAITIHRLLKWDAQKRAFTHNQDKPLDCELLVIDEVSMLDTQLASSLFAAVRPGTRVVLVGDKDQLPSVGPGAVLCDLIGCGKIPVTYLTQVYRQSVGSRIITNAHAVNNGELPDLTPAPRSVKADFYWVEQDDPVRAARLIVFMATERIPKVFGFNPLTDIQVLTPMRKGDCGTIALNQLLQNTLNPPTPDKPAIQFGNRIFRTGDKVMQTSNNYDKGVFNGEMGLVTLVDTEANCFTVLFDVGRVEYQQHEADQLQLAYAVTVHKSQGSEFPVVLMPVLSQHYVMLQRNLLYTGMTRAKKLLILTGSRRALAIAIHNNTPNLRRTRLAQRIIAGMTS